MGKRLNTPHDSLFKEIMDRPPEAASMIRDGVSQTLCKYIDWSTLRQMPADYLTALRPSAGDRLYTVQLAGRPVFIHLMIEHQSIPDADMAIRIAEYRAALIRRYRKDHPGAKVPPIIPLVVHTGHTGKPWNAATSLLDYYDLEDLPADLLEEILPYLSHKYYLDDLGRVDVDDIERRAALTALMRVTLMTMRMAARSSGPEEVLKRVGRMLQRLGDGVREPLFDYIEDVSNNGRREISEDRWLAAIEEYVGKPGMEEYMSFKAQAIAAARADGRADGRAETLIDQLTDAFGSLKQDLILRIRSASVDEVRVWALRFRDAKNLQDVFV